NKNMSKETYQDNLTAPGYQACPEHSDKRILFDLLDVESRIGMQLTDSYAMNPPASVSGFYFAHPQARYFSVGKIDLDQVTSMAERRGVSVEEVSKLLTPVIA